MNNFQYLTSGGSFSVDGVNDSKDFGETIAGELHLRSHLSFFIILNFLILSIFICTAMKVMGFPDSEQQEIWNIVAAILHLGNINFAESGNYAQVSDSGGNQFLNGSCI